MPKASATLLFTLCSLLLLTAAPTAATSAAAGTQTTTTPTQPPAITVNIPSGSYMLSCNTCKISGNNYSCKCKVYNNLDSSLPSWVSTTIDLTTCTVDSSGFYELTNSYGKLVCTTS